MGLPSHLPLNPTQPPNGPKFAVIAIIAASSPGVSLSG